MNKLESKNCSHCNCLEIGAHVAVFDKNLLDKVLNGNKRLDTRFSKEKCAPYDSINNGDTIYLKESDGPIVAKAKAVKIKFYANLDDEKIQLFKYTYNTQLYMDDDFWNRESDSHYATLFTLKDVEGIPPVALNNQDQSSWVVLDENNNHYECTELP